MNRNVRAYGKNEVLEDWRREFVGGEYSIEGEAD
jgi:hypothetical protein